jgi:hypothetical protein
MLCKSKELVERPSVASCTKGSKERLDTDIKVKVTFNGGQKGVEKYKTEEGAASRWNISGY